jgi:hypothetical protein
MFNNNLNYKPTSYYGNPVTMLTFVSEIKSSKEIIEVDVKHFFEVSGIETLVLTNLNNYEGSYISVPDSDIRIHCKQKLLETLFSYCMKLRHAPQYACSFSKIK